MAFETTYANQSHTIDEIMDGLTILIRKSLNWSSDRVIEWHDENRPNVDVGRSIVWFRFADEDVDGDSGAGRHGMKTKIGIEVTFTTRMFRDGDMRDKKLARSHWAAHFALKNGLVNRMLHDAYDNRVDDEPPKATQIAGVLSIGTMVTRSIPAQRRPRPETGYVETRFQLEIPCVLKLSVNDAPVLLQKTFPKGA